MFEHSPEAIEKKEDSSHISRNEKQLMLAARMGCHSDEEILEWVLEHAERYADILVSRPELEALAESDLEAFFSIMEKTLKEKGTTLH